VPDQPKLSLAEWIVLALIAEGPRHGFAVASLTAETGDIGRVWHVPRPIVYRAADRLVGLALLRIDGTEQGRGPQRSILATTKAGAAAVPAWLHSPVTHVRDGRSELLVKLALLSRAGDSAGGLITAQREVFTQIEATLLRQQDGRSGFDWVLTTWRIEGVRSALRFLDALPA
jgi:DNA-binding PadR family transcriptional regulator